MDGSGATMVSHSSSSSVHLLRVRDCGDEFRQEKKDRHCQGCRDQRLKHNQKPFLDLCKNKEKKKEDQNG